jgi:sulfite reductase alpha subunit-like flavoprotein
VVVYATVRGVIRKGLCSSFLQQTTHTTSTSNRSSTVRLFIVNNAYFRLPKQENLRRESLAEKDLLAALDHPLLMFAVGSGIAPFRSFWQELQQLRELNKTIDETIPRVLFFGCRTPTDFLFAQELQSLRDEHRIFTSIIPVYSRANTAAKQYVQDAVFDHPQLIHSILTNEQSFIYMCGSTRACQGIESALASVLQMSSNGTINAEESKQKIDTLKQNGKIKQDMFG